MARVSGWGQRPRGRRRRDVVLGSGSPADSLTGTSGGSTNSGPEGEQVEVKVINIDPSGKVRLSRKVLLKEGEGTSPKYPGAGEAYNSTSPGGGDDRRGGGDRDRGPRR